MAEPKPIELEMNLGKDIHGVEHRVPWIAYDKDEVDAVIADLEESHKMEVEQLLMEIVKLKTDYKEACDRLQTANLIKDEQLAATRHHKYKRCLDKAKRCFTKSNYHFVLARHGDDVKANSRKTVLYSKWYERWLALAEKFKPNKG